MSVASVTNIATASGAGQTSAPASATITNLVGPASPTPTFSVPYVSTVVDPQTIYIGESALVTVRLNNVPAEGYTSAEFTAALRRVLPKRATSPWPISLVRMQPWQSMGRTTTVSLWRLREVKVTKPPRVARCLPSNSKDCRSAKQTWDVRRAFPAEVKCSPRSRLPTRP